MNENFYTVEEIAKKLGVSSKSVRRYICNKKLDAIKIGGQWRIDPKAYEKFLGHGSECCSTNESSISKDDFCVFMDSDYFSSEDKMQICTIVDYYVDNSEEVKEIVGIIMDRIGAAEDNSKSEMRFNYIYDKEYDKARFVLWGSPSFLGELLCELKKFE